jgi:hypothetical protein
MKTITLRLLLFLVVATLLLAAAFVAPSVGAGSTPLPAAASPPYVVCPVGEAGGGLVSRLGAFREGGGQGLVTVVDGAPDPIAFDFSESSTYRVELAELAELGLTPVLIEADRVAATTYSHAGGAASLAGCLPASPDPVAVMGMSTSAGDGSTLIISNPFAIEAAVQMRGASEFGDDTPTDLEQVRVPAFTNLEFDFGQILTGRASLSFVVRATAGSVVAGMRRTGENDIASSEAIAGSTEWFFAIPDLGIDGAIHLRAIGDGDTAFRIDPIGADLLAEALVEGQLGANEVGVFPLSGIGPAIGGLVVTTNQPSAAVVVYAGPEARAVSPGATTVIGEWLVPVSASRSEGQNAVWLLNGTDRVVSATITSLEEANARTLQVPAGGTAGAIISNLDGSGASIIADGPIAAFFGVLGSPGIGMSVAVPLE